MSDGGVVYPVLSSNRCKPTETSGVTLDSDGNPKYDKDGNLVMWHSVRDDCGSIYFDVNGAKEPNKAGFDILSALKLRRKGVNFVSCPTCGRCKIDLIGLAHKVEERFKNLDKPITIATMGCPVNGPNEAKDADYGIAGAIGEGYIFKKGELIKKVKENELLDEFEKIVLSDLD